MAVRSLFRRYLSFGAVLARYSARPTRHIFPHASVFQLPWQPPISARHCTLTVDLELAKGIKPTEDDICVVPATAGIERESRVGNPLDSGKSFSELGVPEDVVLRLEAMGCGSAFEIQALTLPHTLAGRDVIGRAITGSGKTLAFALPIVQILSKSSRGRQPRAIVITPTRELCKQVTQSIQSLSRGVRCASLYGGASYASQESALRGGVDVVCATPGRLNDHLERETFDLSEVQFLILDEADELLTPNFKEQINSLLEDCPPSKQMMLFSATLPRDIKLITKKFMKDPVLVDLTSDRSAVPTNIQHDAIAVRRDMSHVVADLLITQNPKRAIVFTTTKIHTNELSNWLNQLSIRSQALNSDLSQSMRENILEGFRDGSNHILVATNVAARGIDVPEVDLVIQVGLPDMLDHYIHRSGRTGRKGQPGRAVLLYRPGYEADAFLDELEQVVTLEHIRPPTKQDMLAASIERAVEEVEGVSPAIAKSTLDAAQNLYDRAGVPALAAALAVVGKITWQSRPTAPYTPDHTQQKRDRSRRGGTGNRRWGYEDRSRRSYGNHGNHRGERGGTFGRHYPQRNFREYDNRGNDTRTRTGKSSWEYGNRGNDDRHQRSKGKKDWWHKSDEL